MMLIGIDPHKSTHTAAAVEPAGNRDLASIRIDATLAGYDRLLAWAAQWPDRRWAVENAAGLGRHLASWLLARGERVLDVPSTATARVRRLSRGGGRKNDRLDAAAAACVAALQGDGRSLTPEGHHEALALLDERRTNLAQARVRAVNQLHALLRALLPGGASRDLSAAKAAELIRPAQPAGAAEQVRAELAHDLIDEIRTLDGKLAANAKNMAALVRQSGSTLTETVGIGPVTAARLLGRTGNPGRFRSPAAYASYAGAAPIEMSSGEHTRHRLSRAGDRQLNSALHTVAITQIRKPTSPGHAYYQRKLAEGKTPREARRCLKRRLADHIWRTMITDEQPVRRASPGGHQGATLTSSAAGSTPTTSTSDKSLPEPATNQPTTPSPRT